MGNSFNNHIRQILLLAVIILIGFLLLKHFYIFLPGILGAITLYILSRKTYFTLIEKKKWRRGWTAFLYIFGYLIIIGLPVYLAVALLMPRIVELFNNPVQIMVAVKTFSQKVMEATGIELYNGQSLQNATQKIAGSLPSFLTGTANFVTNLLLMFFVLYYMLIHGRKMEKYLSNFIPLKEKNLEILSQETNLMIRANAIGIPLLAIIQDWWPCSDILFSGLKIMGFGGLLPVWLL